MFRFEQCRFKKNRKICAVANRENNIYKIVFKNKIQKCANVGLLKEGLKEWHSKIVHQNIDHVKNILHRSGIKYQNGEDI